MPFLDDDRLRYPIEYIDLTGGRISNVRPIPGKPDLLTFSFISHLGFSIFGQARTDLVGELKEGTIQSGTANGILKFTVPDNKDLTATRIFLTIEEWENVVVA